MAQQPQARPLTGKLLPPEPLIYPTELFKLICKQEDRELRKRMLVEYYKKDVNHAKVLRSIAELTWHPAIVWELPEGAPPYAAASPFVGQTPSTMFRALREASRFLKGGGGFIEKALKREHYFAQILESLSVPEANLLIAIKDKKIEEIYPYVRLDLFVEVFPAWFPTEVVQNTRPFLGKVENPLPKEETPPKEEPYLPNGNAASNLVNQYTTQLENSLEENGEYQIAVGGDE